MKPIRTCYTTASSVDADFAAAVCEAVTRADFFGAVFWTATLVAAFLTVFFPPLLVPSSPCLFDTGLSCGDWFRSCRRRLLRRPPFLQSGDDCGPASSAQSSFKFRRFRRGWRWWRRLSPDLRPSPLLGFFHPLPCGSGEFLPFTWRSFRSGGGGWFRATVQHGLKFGNLEVDPGLLRLESCYGGDDDFVREFCRHVNLSQPFTLTHFSRLGAPPRDTQFCGGLPFLPHSPTLALTFGGSPNDGCPPPVWLPSPATR